MQNGVRGQKTQNGKKKTGGKLKIKSGSVRQLERSTGIQCSFPGGLLITFVKQRQSPKTFRAARLFSCLCFYDFPKRTAPKIHKIWHLVNLINVRWPFAKKKWWKLKTTLWHFCGVCFLLDLDDPICWTWMLYAGCVLSFSVTIRIPPAVPAGAELSFGGAAAPIQPTYTLIRIFGATGTRQPGHTHNPRYCLRKVFNWDYPPEKKDGITKFSSSPSLCSNDPPSTS